MRMRFILIISLFFCTVVLSGCVNQGESVKSDNRASRQQSAEAYITLGFNALQDKDIVKARQQFYHALALDPSNPDVLDGLAYFQEITGELENASQTYQKAIAYNSRDGDTYNDYGTFLCRHGQYQKSIEQFNAAVKQPTYLYIAAAYENAGLCAALIPDAKLAEQYLKHAIAEDPTRILSLFELARLNFQQGKEKKARTLFMRIVAQNKAKASDFMRLMLKKSANNSEEKINQNQTLPKNLQALKQIKKTHVQKRVRIKPSLALLPLPDTLNKKKIVKVKVAKVNIVRRPPPAKKPIKKPEVPSAPKPPALKPVIKADTGGKQWQQVLSKEKSLIAHHELALPNP